MLTLIQITLFVGGYVYRIPRKVKAKVKTWRDDLDDAFDLSDLYPPASRQGVVVPFPDKDSPRPK